jgi:hypothetical protein
MRSPFISQRTRASGLLTSILYSTNSPSLTSFDSKPLTNSAPASIN